MHHVFHIILKRRFILFGALLVWLLFVASFFMPVTKDVSMVGWQAFGVYVGVMWDLPEYWRQIAREPMAVLISTFPSTNCAVFIAPLIPWRWPRWAGWLGFVLVLGGLAPLFGFYESIVKNQLLAGFYCWVISIFLMAALSFLCAKAAKAKPLRGGATEFAG